MNNDRLQEELSLTRQALAQQTDRADGMQIGHDLLADALTKKEAEVWALREEVRHYRSVLREIRMNITTATAYTTTVVWLQTTINQALNTEYAKHHEGEVTMTPEEAIDRLAAAKNNLERAEIVTALIATVEERCRKEMQATIKIESIRPPGPSDPPRPKSDRELA